MSAIAILILILTIALPIAWFVSEFSAPRRVRLVLGTLAVLLSFGVAFIVDSLERLNSNAWFGGVTKDLIDTTVTELDAGRDENVVRALKELQAEFQPTYENRARYDELVRQTVDRMKQAPRVGRPPNQTPQRTGRASRSS